MLKTYKLSEAANPPQTPSSTPIHKTWNTLPTYDISYFPGPCSPQSSMSRYKRTGQGDDGPAIPASALRGQTLRAGCGDDRHHQGGAWHSTYDAMQHYFVTPGKTMVPYWPGSQWQVWNFAKPGRGRLSLRHRRPHPDRRTGRRCLFLDHLSA